MSIGAASALHLVASGFELCGQPLHWAASLAENLGDPALNSTAVLVIVLCLLRGKWTTALFLFLLFSLIEPSGREWSEDPVLNGSASDEATGPLPTRRLL